MQDKKVKCIESGCGKEFTITVGEQKYFHEMKFDEPKRCKACRSKKKALKMHNHLMKGETTTLQ